MNNFQQLMIAEDGSITVEEKKFISLHNEIIHCGRMTCEFAIQMAIKLKEMRDDKLYVIAGFEKFGDYVEQAVGLKERQAYNYIKVYEDLPKDFLQSNAKIGVTKLTLLASITASNREEIMENENIGEISVRELKDKIKELEKTTERMQLDLDFYADEKEKAIEEIKESQKKQLEDLEAKQKKKLEKLKKEKEKLKQEVETLKNTPKEIETVYKKDPELEKDLDEKTKSLQDKEKELEKKQEEINTLQKKLSANDNAMIIFKIKFEEFQKKANELLIAYENVPEDKKINCKKAIQAVLDGLNL